jgi:hypothetical protein
MEVYDVYDTHPAQQLTASSRCRCSCHSPGSEARKARHTGALLPEAPAPCVRRAEAGRGHSASGIAWNVEVAGEVHFA